MKGHAVPIAATGRNAADAQRAPHAALPRPAGPHLQAAPCGHYARARPWIVAIRTRVAADHRRRAHRPDQARLGHGVRQRRGRRQGRDLPRRRDRAVPGRHAAGGRGGAGQGRRVRRVAPDARHRPRRGLQRLAADGARAQGGADRAARRRGHGDLRGRLQERRSRLARVVRRDAARPRGRRRARDRRGAGERNRRPLRRDRRRPQGPGGGDPARRRARDGDLRGAPARAAGMAPAARRTQRQSRQHRGRGRDRAGDAPARPALRHARSAAAGLIFPRRLTHTAVMSSTARFGRADSTAGAPVVVARQPILDRTENVIGFELLSPSEPIMDPRGQTASVLVQSFADVGIDRLVGALPAYVSVTRELLLTVRPIPLSPEGVVLEVDASDADDILVALIRDAVNDGFRVALDDFRHTAGSEALLALSNIVKLDIAKLDSETLTGTVASLSGHGVALFPKNVETRAQYDACRALGFDGSQGRFFSEPARLLGTSAPTYRLRALSMLAARGDLSSLEQLERVIVEDPCLAHKLVRLANSAFFGPRHPVGSIRQALMMLGSVAVRRWATLLVLAGVTDRPNHLLELGLTRARLCELIAMRDDEADTERAFTVGLFSVVDALLQIPMPQLLEELPFDDRAKFALTEHVGPEGRILGGVLAYESGDFDACNQSSVGLIAIARAYREALDWTTDAALAIA